MNKKAYVVKRVGEGADVSKIGQLTWSTNGGPLEAWNLAKKNANYDG